jgi:hypothetical protein
MNWEEERVRAEVVGLRLRSLREEGRVLQLPLVPPSYGDGEALAWSDDEADAACGALEP